MTDSPAAAADVLVIDDNIFHRSVAADALGALGWSVRIAEHGEAALAAIARRVPDLILLDLHMPTLDGFGFLEQLRDVPGAERVPVVLYTSEKLAAPLRDRLRGRSAFFIGKADATVDQVIEQVQRIARAIRPAGSR